MNKIITLLGFLIILISSCKKERESLPLPKTLFVGVFQAKDKQISIKSNVGLQLNHDNTFSFSNQDTYNYPMEKYMYYIVDGSGKYSIKNDIIIFQDTLNRTLQAMYPYYLQGKYKYYFNGDKLILKAENSNAEIEYSWELLALKNKK